MVHQNKVAPRNCLTADRDIEYNGHSIQRISMCSFGHSALISSGSKVMPVDQSHVVYYGIFINRLQMIGDREVHRQTHKGVVCY